MDNKDNKRDSFTAQDFMSSIASLNEVKIGNLVENFLNSSSKDDLDYYASVLRCFLNAELTERIINKLTTNNLHLPHLIWAIGETRNPELQDYILKIVNDDTREVSFTALCKMDIDSIHNHKEIFSDCNSINFQRRFDNAIQIWTNKNQIKVSCGNVIEASSTTLEWREFAKSSKHMHIHSISQERVGAILGLYSGVWVDISIGVASNIIFSVGKDYIARLLDLLKRTNDSSGVVLIDLNFAEYLARLYIHKAHQEIMELKKVRSFKVHYDAGDDDCTIEGVSFIFEFLLSNETYVRVLMSKNGDLVALEKTSISYL